MSTDLATDLAIVRGIPLSEEPGLGTLTLPGYLREVTERWAGREAMVLHTPQGAIRWSYTDLWDRAMEVARALLACGTGKGTRVGVMMTNRPEWIAATFGITLAGGIAVTISTFSTPPELEYMLKISGVAILLVERAVLKKDFVAVLLDMEPKIREARPGELISEKLPFLRRIAVLGDVTEAGALESWSDFLKYGASIAPSVVEATAATVTPADTAAIFFSSGSTSRPKGILNSHRGIAVQCWRFMRMFNFPAGGNLRCWSANGFFWSGNFSMALGATFASGGSLVLQRTFDAGEALHLMALEKVNYPAAWPHQWAQLEAEQAWANTDLSAMVYIDPINPIWRHPSVTHHDWLEPRAYGNTETFTFSAAFPSGTPLAEINDGHGYVLPGCILKIVNEATGETVKIGEFGEIAVKGATLMQGYLGIPADETLDEAGFFRTGDAGYFDAQGRLYWKGRLNDIIKTGGANVSPLEIDEVLAAIPGVKVGKTVGVPDKMLGELVVACIVLHDGAMLTEASIRDYVKERLASYKVPRRVLFVREEDLSLTGSAKVKTSALRELAAKMLA
jgi:fatty-acyl-CoA synthase